MSNMFNASEVAKTVNPIRGVAIVHCRVCPSIAKQHNAMDYLRVHLANCLDWDKDENGRVLSFKERIAKVNTSASSLTLIAASSTAKARSQALATLNEFQRLRDHLINGGTLDNYKSGFIVEFDACNSLLQYFATLTGCVKTARLVNLIANADGSVVDGYMEFYKYMQKLMTPAERAKYDKKLTRKVLKELIMHYFYGGTSTAVGLFGSYKSAMYKKFEKTLETLAPGAIALRKRILNLIDKKRVLYSWTRPDGFEVKTNVLTKRSTTCKVSLKLTDSDNPKPISFTSNFRFIGICESFCALLANIVHSLDSFICAEMKRRMEYDKATFKKVKRLIREALDKVAEQERAITNRKTIASARFIELISDDPTLLDTLSNNEKAMLLELIDDCLQFKYAEICTIHDAFKTTANNVGIARYHYKRLMLELAESNLVNDLLSEITGTKTTFDKFGTSLPSLIQESDYAIM